MIDQRPAGLVPASETDLLTCAREQIHTPGAIQPHGFLLAVRVADMVITHVSGNIGTLTNMTPKNVLGSLLSDILGDAVEVAVRDAVFGENYLLMSVVTLELPLSSGQMHVFHIHSNAALIIIEIEGAGAGDQSRNVLESAKTALSKIRDAATVESLCDQVVREIRRLTGYDRVMVYWFDRDGHGTVIAEAKTGDMEPYLGLRYPASDIPQQARQLYLLARIRLIPDVSYESVSIEHDDGAGVSAVIDMSHCLLRSVSPIHLEYVRNMGVAATLTISIIQDQRLWGMIVCHHRTPLMMPYGARMTCDIIGQLLGLLISEVDERVRLADLMAREKNLARVSEMLEARDSVLDSLAEAGTDLLKLVDATGALIRLAGRSRAVGNVVPIEIASKILDVLRSDNNDEIFMTENLGSLQPQFKPWKDIASGVLVLPFANHFGDGIIWFRGEVVQTVKWGGDPNEKAHLEPVSRRISPRKSFEMWKEVVEGCSKPWTDADEAAASGLRRVLGRALLRQTEVELFRISNSDPLTGLSNRSVLNERLNKWRSTTPTHPAALLFFDIDRFKNVNDSLGHYAGDDLLREVAGRIAGLVGTQHLAVRLGGDEFVIFAEEIDESEAWKLAQSILRVFDQPFVVAGRPHRASTSVGLVYGNVAKEDLLRDADAAMYVAKQQGGNRAVLFEAKLHEAAYNKLQIEQDLFLALDREEFSVHYQPIVTLPNGNLRGFEALARWRHPDRGWISPSVFIPMAEETGQIERIGRWVTAQAIQTLARIEDKAVIMTINVSGIQLVTGCFADQLAANMAAELIEPSRITIEVTESVLMAEQAVRELERVRTIGCSIAIDDFGTGYSSLAYLRRLPVDIIKIDRSFVSPLGDEPGTVSFLSALVKLIQTLRLTVVAEGVETQEQSKILSEMSCDAAQGYFFGKPTADCDFSFAP